MTSEPMACATTGENIPALRAFLLYFLRLGTFGFGGPIALAGYMQRDLVETRKWISPQDYKEGLALAQLSPGPLAAQLAMYLGWVRFGRLGSTLVAAAFILPSFMMVVVLSALYLRYGGLSWMQAAFYGVGAAVIAIVARSAWKLVKTTVGKDRLLLGICVVSGLITAWTETEYLPVFLGSGVLALGLQRWQSRATMTSIAAPFAWIFSGLHGPGQGELLRLAWYFTEAGAFVFGSGLAIVPFLHGGVVDRYHWLTERQFLDAVAVAMITPGPVVITVAFIGFLVAGAAGGLVASAGVFLPPYLVVIALAPSVRRWASDERVRAFVGGVTAAAAGAIGGAAFVLGRRAIIDVPTAIIGLVSLVVLTKTKKVPEPVLILAAAAVGLVVHRSPLGR
jgi:chromate transporter